MPGELWDLLVEDSYKRKCHEIEVSDDLFLSGVEIGIYIHDKTLEILTPKETIIKYKEYAKLYERNKEVYIPEYYQDNGIVQVDLSYFRRCIESYGLNADEILKKVHWNLVFEQKD